MNQLISVIVPVYKVEQYLDRCVQSIVNQTYKNLEIILVDDGSPDNCPAMCDAWAEKDSRIRVIHKENGGVSSARNAGLNMATGDYITFVDADDSLDFGALESLYFLVDTYHAEVSVCGFEYVRADGSVENKSQECGSDLICSDNSTDHLILFFKYFYQLCYCWNHLYSKKFFYGDKPVRFSTDISMAEDVLFNVQVLNECNRFIVNSEEHTYNYFQNGTSATHVSVDGGKNWVDNVKSYETILRCLEDDDVKSLAALIFLQNILKSVWHLVLDNGVRSEHLDEVIAISRRYKKMLFEGFKQLHGNAKCKGLLYLCTPKLYCRVLKMCH